MTEMHPDPIGDTGQKAAQYIQLLAMAAEAVAVILAARARAEAERDQQKADAINAGLTTNHKAAADLWEPVLADHKRDSLDVAQTLTAWSAAQAWKEADPNAQHASDMAEERLHDLRPAAMMRYDDLRSQGLDPVSAMRQVVPLLETDPRIGEQGLRAGALAAAASSVVDEDQAADLDAGRLPNTAATQVLAAELDEERNGYEPPYGLSGYELTYGVEDRMAGGPHQGWDGRDVDELHQELAANQAAPAADVADPWAAAMSVSASSTLVDVEAAAALLVTESALLSQIEHHRQLAAQEGRVAGGEQAAATALRATPDDPTTRLVDEHLEAVSAAQPRLALVSDAGAHAHVERDAAQALAASYPTAVTDVTATAAAASSAATPAAAVAKQTASKPQLVRS